MFEKYKKVYKADYEKWYKENEAYRERVAADPDRRPHVGDHRRADAAADPRLHGWRNVRRTAGYRTGSEANPAASGDMGMAAGNQRHGISAKRFHWCTGLCAGRSLCQPTNGEVRTGR